MHQKFLSPTISMSHLMESIMNILELVELLDLLDISQ